jgi:hypothetical protein
MQVGVTSCVLLLHCRFFLESIIYRLRNTLNGNRPSWSFDPGPAQPPYIGGGGRCGLVRWCAQRTTTSGCACQASRNPSLTLQFDRRRSTRTGAWRQKVRTTDSPVQQCEKRREGRRGLKPHVRAPACARVLYVRSIIVSVNSRENLLMSEHLV